MKDKIDLLFKRAELIYKKLLIFLAIAGGSWIYGLKDHKMSSLLLILVAIVFVLSVIAIVVNLLKYGAIQKELKDLTDG
ncbi:MAG TPA: hypothetical protein ENK99_06615 [Campylobacterales bacterium]|nr:hypothetical protein [Campylobacterales bacterium]